VLIDYISHGIYGHLRAEQHHEGFHHQGETTAFPGPRHLYLMDSRRCDTRCAAPWRPVRNGTGKSSYAASVFRWCRGFHTKLYRLDTRNVPLARARGAIPSVSVLPQSGIRHSPLPPNPNAAVKSSAGVILLIESTAALKAQIQLFLLLRPKYPQLLRLKDRSEERAQVRARTQNAVTFPQRRA
jgi:hypothetical protein